jgi:N-acetylmuramoyl-L-alanine amidase
MRLARIGLCLALGGAMLLAACTSASPTPSRPLASGSVQTTSSPSPRPGQVIPAPGSNSDVYKPNPSAIVVAIDPGHGGCLDWGVPNPYDNKVAKAEKTITLGIGLALKALLEAQGVTVVMTRTDDSALAGDDYPPLGCTGAPFRDVNGDGIAGFGPTVPEATRTRDELSARIDLANLARADLLVSIHINSLTQNGVVYKIAATQTFFTDAFPWVRDSKRLADQVEAAVVSSMAAVATAYHRQDRGTDGSAPYLYLLKPAGTDPKSPRRGLFMPAILSEVGSLSLEAEGELLATPAGQQAAAQGVYNGIAAYLGDRPLAGRIDAEVPGGAAGTAPAAAAGTGPPFWAPVLPPAASGAYHFNVRLVNTGMEPWPSGMQLVVGWGASSGPYLAATPPGLDALPGAVPALRPGESVSLPVTVDVASGDGRHVLWMTLRTPSGQLLSGLGEPALELASAAK